MSASLLDTQSAGAVLSLFSIFLFSSSSIPTSVSHPFFSLLLLPCQLAIAYLSLCFISYYFDFMHFQSPRLLGSLLIQNSFALWFASLSHLFSLPLTLCIEVSRSQLGLHCSVAAPLS
uniref:Uncharacterized protein n=1 Tax=Octopus bimaculoides TaxID=37653 RepID=A0A0L8HXA2_OCTBM